MIKISTFVQLSLKIRRKCLFDLVRESRGTPNYDESIIFTRELKNLQLDEEY